MSENVRAAGWRKASYSNSSGSCVEVGNAATAILVRDTACRDGLTLTIPAPAWRALLAEVRASWPSLITSYQYSPKRLAAPARQPQSA
jgi:hypothetical protein